MPETTPRPSARETLRALLGAPLHVMGLTLGVLLAGVPTVVVVAMVANDAVDGGAVALCAMIVAGGLWTISSLWWQARSTGILHTLGEGLGLATVPSGAARHYAGRVFADGSHVVDRGVRTKQGRPLVEVGEYFPVTTPRAHEVRQQRAYLRLRLEHPAPPGSDAGVVLTPELTTRLTALLGPHEVEVSADELTVTGTQRLEVRTRAALQAAVDLGDDLHERADAAWADAAPATTPSGVPIPAAPRARAARGRRRGPFAVVLGTLGLLVIGTLGIAVVMASLEPLLRGNEIAATLVVGGLVVPGALALTGVVVRRLVSPREGRRR